MPFLGINRTLRANNRFSRGLCLAVVGIALLINDVKERCLPKKLFLVCCVDIQCLFVLCFCLVGAVFVRVSRFSINQQINSEIGKQPYKLVN